MTDELFKNIEPVITAQGTVETNEVHIELFVRLDSPVELTGKKTTGLAIIRREITEGYKQTLVGDRVLVMIPYRGDPTQYATALLIKPIR